MDLELVITRLQSLKDDKTLAVINGAADLASAKIDASNAYPSAWVIPLAESGGPNMSATQFVMQRVGMRFGVLFAIRNRRDARSQANLNDLNPIRKAVMANLIGWLPPGADDLVSFSGGKLLRIQDGILWWQDEFLTAFYLRSQ
jgi:hypothetical protein